MGIEDIPIAREGELPSAAGHNAMRDMLGRQHTAPLLVSDSTGMHQRRIGEEDGEEFQYFELYDALAPAGSAEAYPMNWDNDSSSYVTDLLADTITVYDVPPTDNTPPLDGRHRGRARDETAPAEHDLTGLYKVLLRGRHGSQGLAIWRNGRWEICWLQPHATWLTCQVDESSFTGGSTIAVDTVVITEPVDTALAQADIVEVQNIHGWTDISDDAVLQAVWNDSTELWDAVQVVRNQDRIVRFAKAQAGWDCEDDPATVSVKFSNIDGSVEIGAAFDVVLLASNCQDPNVCVGDVIAITRCYDAAVAPTGTYIAVSSYLDDKIGMIKMWSGCPATDIPCGWALCDGTNGTVDLSGKFVVQIGGSAKDGGPYRCGDAEGFAYHGDLENNHDDHHLQMSPVMVSPTVADHDDHAIPTLGHEEITIVDHVLQYPPIADHTLNYAEDDAIDAVNGQSEPGSVETGETDSHTHTLVLDVAEFITDITASSHAPQPDEYFDHLVDSLPPHPARTLYHSPHVVTPAWWPGHTEVWGHKTTDNRPPYYALAFIQRICACTPS